MAKNITFTVSKKLLNDIVNGNVDTITKPLTETLCKKVRGVGLLCPYGMPSNVEGEKICQKTGKKCVSGIVPVPSVMKLTNKALGEDCVIDKFAFGINGNNELYFKIDKKS